MNDGRRSDPGDFLPLGDLSFHILLALGAGASHGYAIGKEIEGRSGGRLSPATGSLYQALRRLTGDGLIAGTEPTDPPEDDDARRKYFRLTPLGKRVVSLEVERLEGLISLARERSLVRKRS